MIRKKITMALAGLAVMGWLIAGYGLGQAFGYMQKNCACHPISA